MINWTENQKELWCLKALGAIEKLKNFYRGFAMNITEQDVFDLDSYQKYQWTTRYGASREVRGMCPLCVVYYLCSECPWEILEGGNSCTDFFDKQTIRERFSRLNRWETSILRRLNEIMAVQ